MLMYALLQVEPPSWAALVASIRCGNVVIQTQGHPQSDPGADIIWSGFKEIALCKRFPTSDDLRKDGYHVVRIRFVLIQRGAVKKYSDVENVSFEMLLLRLSSHCKS